MMKLTRRQLLDLGFRAAGVGAVASLLPSGFDTVGAAAGQSGRRFVQIFLRGAWNTNFSIDPVVGAKRTSGAYDSAHLDLEVTPVPGKGALLVGAGFKPAVSAFQAMPTAFVNGIQMEVTAHDIAFEYMATGRSPLRFPFEPALAVAMGQATGGFPTHVMLNAPSPIGKTARAAPYLLIGSSNQLGTMFRSPVRADFAAGTLALGDAFAKQLDDSFKGRLTESAADDVALWTEARSKIIALSEKYGDSLKLSDELEKRYGVVRGKEAGAPFAGALVVLRSGLARFLSMSIFGFDTHTDELDRQIPAQNAAATALARFVEDLAATPDPDDASKKLIETTTLLVTSEFTRTPKFNGAEGTDHWGAAGAIVMGAGVRDGVVVGAMSDNAGLLGWEGGAAVALTAQNALTPEMVAASILRALGFPERAALVSEVPLDGLFV